MSNSPQAARSWHPLKILVTATIVGLLLSLISHTHRAEAGPSSVYASWSVNSTTKSGSMTLPAAGYPNPTARFVTDGNVQTFGGTTNFLPTYTPVGTLYGSSSGFAYLSVSRKSSSTDASVTTYTFDAPMPVGTWSFILGDINSTSAGVAETVRVSATDSLGAPVNAATIDAWWTSGNGGPFNYCNSPTGRPSGCNVQHTKVPDWNSATSTLSAPAGSIDTDNGIAGWFTPTVSLKTLTFTFSAGDGFSRYQTWFAADPVTDPLIVSAPASLSVLNGEPASFSVSGSGTAPLNYQWQQSTDGGLTWSDIAGATGTTFSIASTSLSQNGLQLRAYITNTANIATSGAAVLTVRQPVSPPPPPEPEPTPTPTPPPPPEPSVDEVFITEEIQQLPAGQALVFEGSTPVQVQVVTNPTQQVQTIQGSTWALDLTALAPNGKPTLLTADGAVDVTAGGELALTGSGLTPGSVVNVFLIDPTQSLGSFIVGPDGTFSAMIPVPAGLAAGRYVVQANGTTPAGQVRSTSVGLLVNNRQPRIGTLKATVYFDVRSAVLDKKAKRTLARLARKVPSEASVSRIRSVGFVQPESFTANDQRLSTQRARNVVRQLRKDGVRGPTVIRGNGQAKQSGAKARRATVTVTYEIYQ
jgi:outer membrane protein OmpA-like peptidoglycan-associated protein